MGEESGEWVGGVPVCVNRYGEGPGTVPTALLAVSPTIADYDWSANFVSHARFIMESKVKF